MENAYFGYHFDGWNGNAIWEGNEMCNNWAGLVLMNNGIIGTQGSPTLASGNVWEQNIPWGGSCDNWFGFQALYHTYCDNSDPALSFLYVKPTPVHEPTFNWFNTFGSPLFYSLGPSIDNSGTINRLEDCFQPVGTPVPPAWKLISGNEDNSAQDQLMPQNEFLLIPNPAKNSFRLHFKHKPEQASLVIRDLTGRVQSTFTLQDHDSDYVDISSLAVGLYLIEVYENANYLGSKKFVKID